MSDEGFREIQLNGKQLVFLFMAATVVSVVIFLFGVLVGRGVRTDPSTEVVAGDIAPDPNRPVAEEIASPPAAAAPTGAPAATADAGSSEVTYAERLLRDSAPEENLKESAPAVQEPVPPEPRVTAAPTPAPPPAPTPAPTPAATPAPAPAKAAARPAVVEKPPPATPAQTAAAATATNGTASPSPAGTASPPTGPGFAVQVSIFDSRQEADKLANQLIAKGYPAFVVDPAKGARGIYRVRVGKYRNRKDAEEISVRLEKNEQFKPWIAR